MNNKSVIARVLAEVFRLQRWAGGDSVSAAQIFGLMNGFETDIEHEENVCWISKEEQRKVEDLLQEVEFAETPVDGMSLKCRLQSLDIDETVANKVIQRCQLQGRFGVAINKLINCPGSVFHRLQSADIPEHQWFGATRYMELVDATSGDSQTSHSVFAATIPRVGEIFESENGKALRVVEVRYCLVSQGENVGIKQNYLVPYVYLKEDAFSDQGGSLG